MVQGFVVMMQDEDVRRALGKRIKLLRKQRNWTQKELAEKLDLRQPQLNKYESGMNAPPLDKLLLLAREFDTTVDYLLTGSETDKVPVHNRRLLDRLRALQSFEGDIQETVIKLIDALIVQNRVAGVLKPMDTSRT
jgi:transcriptional regulator with XRE-family HTH domain